MAPADQARAHFNQADERSAADIGKQLTPTRSPTHEKAKDELRELYGRKPVN